MAELADTIKKPIANPYPNGRSLNNGFFGDLKPKTNAVAAPVTSNGNPNNPVIYTGANATKPSVAIESQIDPNVALTTNQSAQVKAGNSLIDVDNRNSGILNSLNTPKANLAPATMATTAPIMQSSPVAQATPTASIQTPVAALQTPASNTAIVNKQNPINNPANNSSLYSDQINPATDTVEGRINKLLNTDNPLIQRAVTQTNQSANARGLLNSSIATQAGQEAAIGEARNIATQDAGTYNQQRMQNQQIEQSAWNNYLQSISNIQIQNIPEEDKVTAIANINSIMRGNPAVSFINTWRQMAKA